jgi:hypothetical protein
MTPPATLAVELLVSEHQRRPVTIDELEDAAGDPLTERFLRHRKESQAARVLSILDDIERERRSA